jgi:thiosulfate dehydrogenase
MAISPQTFIAVRVVALAPMWFSQQKRRRLGGMRGFIGGAVAAVVVLCLVVFAVLKTGAISAGADAPMLPGEQWSAHTALNATTAREAPKPPYPFAQTDADVEQGAKLYVQNCAVCHGTASSTANALARGLGVRPPQFNKHDVMDDPEGVTYWKIEHGIRFTGMPAYHPALDEKSIWQITYFLKRAPDHLPAGAKHVWEHPQTVAPPTPMPAEPQSPGQGSTSR